MARVLLLACSLQGLSRQDIIAMLHDDSKKQIPTKTRRTHAQANNILEFSCARARGGCAVIGRDRIKPNYWK